MLDKCNHTIYCTIRYHTMMVIMVKHEFGADIEH